MVVLVHSLVISRRVVRFCGSFSTNCLCVGTDEYRMMTTTGAGCVGFPQSDYNNIATQYVPVRSVLVSQQLPCKISSW